MYVSVPDAPKRRTRARNAAASPTVKSMRYSVIAYRFCQPARATLARIRALTCEAFSVTSTTDAGPMVCTSCPRHVSRRTDDSFPTRRVPDMPSDPEISVKSGARPYLWDSCDSLLKGHPVALHLSVLDGCRFG